MLHPQYTTSNGASPFKRRLNSLVRNEKLYNNDNNDVAHIQKSDCGESNVFESKTTATTTKVKNIQLISNQLFLLLVVEL